ncbi:MAG TPA: TonB-dependent receptor, partial [Chitinophaga sp.]
MKLVALFICGCLGAPIAYAQTGTVTGKLTDTLRHRELGLATVQVRKVADSSLVTYRLSNPSGDFKIPGLPLNTALRLTVTYTGYLPLRKAFTITREHPVLDLGKLEMEITSKQLDEVIIRSEVPPVIMRNDTMEFNADAFKTLPEAVLQDLLKKIPGVAINTKGQLTANGKLVNKIMVDGKLFFSDDPSIALQNLPANVIDKVQVLDDKDQKEELNGEHEEQQGKVINIKLKKAVKKGLFGKVYAGGGTDERYEAGGILNSFRDTLQVSVLAFTNNINQEGFSVGDVKNMGGLDRGNNGSNMWDESYM